MNLAWFMDEFQVVDQTFPTHRNRPRAASGGDPRPTRRRVRKPKGRQRRQRRLRPGAFRTVTATEGKYGQESTN